MTEEELKAKMDELGKLLHQYEQDHLEFDLAHREMVAKIADLKTELKKVFLERKESAKSDCLEVRYRKGAVKWETKWLDTFAIEHPEFDLREHRQWHLL